MKDFQELIDFWFDELTPQDWFKKDSVLDQKIRNRFLATLEQARRCELFSWRKSSYGRLAEIIVLDQFSRNIYRNQAAAFFGDAIALVLAQEAVASQKDQEIEISRRSFFYLPFMHSESRIIHEHAVQLFSQKGLESHLKFELRHKEIIDRFGRFPHRNKLCGRVSTPEEQEFLLQPGSSF